MDDMLDRILDIAKNSCIQDSRIKMLLDEYHRQVAARSSAPTATADAHRDHMDPVLLMPGVLIYLGGRVIIRQDAPGRRYVVSSEGEEDSRPLQSLAEATQYAYSRVGEFVGMGWAELWV